MFNDSDESSVQLTSAYSALLRGQAQLMRLEEKARERNGIKAQITSASLLADLLQELSAMRATIDDLRTQSYQQAKQLAERDILLENASYSSMSWTQRTHYIQEFFQNIWSKTVKSWVFKFQIYSDTHLKVTPKEKIRKMETLVQSHICFLIMERCSSVAPISKIFIFGI